MFGDPEPRTDPRSPVQPARSPLLFFLGGGVVAIAAAILIQRIGDTDKPSYESHATTKEASQSTQTKAAPLHGSLTGVFTNDDYPPAAIDRNEQGTTSVSLTIDTSGRVSQCRIASSSGSAMLDAATCNVIRQRARLAPARNAEGEAVESSYSQSIRWQLAD